MTPLLVCALFGLAGAPGAGASSRERDVSGTTRPAGATPHDDTSNGEKTDHLRILRTTDGVRYGIWVAGPSVPAPTLFIFASTIEQTLGEVYYRQCGTLLAKRGYLCVSVDLPCHGRERQPDEPEGLSGWRHRLDHGEPLIKELNARLKLVLDDLIVRGYTDPSRVAACGVSRGGFAAMHFAANEPRIRCVAAFCPVTDLAMLTEFKGAEQLPVVQSLGLVNAASRLAGKALWVVIGDRDERVGTDAAISFARSVFAESVRQNLAGHLELHVLPEPRGHTIPDGAAKQAAAWIACQIEQKEKTTHED